MSITIVAMRKVSPTILIIAIMAVRMAGMRFRIVATIVRKAVETL